jgi:hypothetical protein
MPYSIRGTDAVFIVMIGSASWKHVFGMRLRYIKAEWFGVVGFLPVKRSKEVYCDMMVVMVQF